MIINEQKIKATCRISEFVSLGNNFLQTKYN